MWLKLVKENVVKPLLRRAGTWLAAFIVFGGNWVCDQYQACGLVNEQGAAMVAAWCVGAAGIALDLCLSYLDKQKLFQRWWSMKFPTPSGVGK